MISIERSPEVDEIARRVIWFAEPDAYWHDPAYFLAYVMEYGTLADIQPLWRRIGKDGFREALLNAPRGVLSARSQRFWEVMTAQ